MLALGDGTVLELSPTILLRALPDQGWYFAFDVANGEQFRLNRTAFWILEAIGTGIQWSDLRDRFLETFEVEPGEGEADLVAVVGRFVEENVIRRVSDG